MRKKINEIKDDSKRKVVRTSVLLSQKEWIALKTIQLAKGTTLRDIIMEFIKSNKKSHGKQK